MAHAKRETLIIFDIDGTITDSVSLQHRAFQLALSELGITKYDSNFSDYLHHTDSYIFRTIFEAIFQKKMKELDLFEFEDSLTKHILQILEEGNDKRIPEILGARKFLQALEEKNYPVVYATGSLEKPARLKLDHQDLKYDSILVSCNHRESREEILEHSVRQASSFHGVDKFKKILSFGDGLWDLKTAHRLGFGFVGIGTKHRDILLKNNAKAHFDDYSNEESIFQSILTITGTQGL